MKPEANKQKKTEFSLRIDQIVKLFKGDVPDKFMVQVFRNKIAELERV